MQRLLFITQNLARTGSEMVLYYLLQHLDPQKYAIHVLCLSKGELYDALPAHIEKSILLRSSGKRSDRLLSSMLKKLKKSPLAYQLDGIQKEFKADLWFVNTISVPDLFAIANKHEVKVVTYLHELLYAFTFIQSNIMRSLITHSDVCIGCSEEVCKRITEMGHTNVRLQHSFVDLNAIKPDWNKVELLKQSLGFLPSDFVWVISAKTTYMKGLDYIVPILEFFKDRPVKILWIGNEESTGLEFYVKETARLNYPGKLFFAGAQSVDYYNYLAIGDGLLLLSREESFSLVLIEAASLGMPMVSFDIGIARQLIGNSFGYVIENRNLTNFVLAMEAVMAEPSPDQQKLLAAASEYSVEKQLAKFETLIDHLF